MKYFHLLTCINAWTPSQVPYKKKGGGEGASHLVRLVRVHLKEGEEIA